MTTQDNHDHVDNKNLLYLLPGQGGRLTRGLGEHLESRGIHVVGRETVGHFRELPFQDQIERVAKDLRDHFWHKDARVIANSYGAYLFLHAQTLLEPFIGRVLLLSPIVGEFDDSETWRSFSPPRPDVLKNLAQSGLYPSPVNCTIYVGENDWQSQPSSVSSFAKATGMSVTVVPGMGHMLDKDYLASVLDRWLPSKGTG